ncbi:MAG TPA: EVE domain-containing protein [Acidobacteriota bacterium]|jgi:predicted RNA-binding protein with PUA-like domain
MFWLLLADPKSYSFDDLEKQKRAVWDGIAGSLAQKHMRNMSRGDTVLIYHTAPDKAVIGTAGVASEPYPDPKDKEKKLVVVDLDSPRRLKKSVPLADLKANRRLAGMTFLKIQRIAVTPLTKEHFDEILRMGK